MGSSVMPPSAMRSVGVGAGPAHGMAHDRCRRKRRAVIREKLLLFPIVNRALAAQAYKRVKGAI